MWPRVPLQDVATVGSKVRRERAGRPLLKLMLDQIEPFSGKVLTKAHIPASAETGLMPFERGDVLWSRIRPDSAKVVVADEPGVASPELVRLIVSPGRLDPEFLAHHLRSTEFIAYAKAFAAGTTRPRLSPALLLRYMIPLPPLNEQRRIVAVLNTIDRIADGNRSTTAMIDNVGRALLVSIVGEPMTWSASETVEPLRSLVRPVSESMTIVSEEVPSVLAGLRVLRPADLLGAELLGDSNEDTTDLEAPSRPPVLAPAGAILIGTEFPISWTTVPVAVSSSQVRIGPRVRALLPARTGIPAIYLADAIRAASSRILVRARSTGRGIVRLDLESLLQLPVPIPSADHLDRLVRYREAIVKTANKVERLRHLINAAKSALQQRAFSGGVA